MISWLTDIQQAFVFGLLSTVLVSTVIGALFWSRWRRQQLLLDDVQQALQQERSLNARIGAENAGLQVQVRQLSELQAQLTAKDQQLTLLQREVRTLESRLADINARAESAKAHHAEQLQLLKDSREQLKRDFGQLANDIFEQKQQRFSEQSKASITALLDPFHRQIEQFRQRVDDIHSRDVEGRSQLLTQLSVLKDMNSQLNRQADDLTKALKGDKKLQGNWGELQIERILESSGLQKGREFEREANYKDDQGQNRRPDFIIHLPDGKHIIIDSKVSLNAYQKAVAADDEATRNAALQAHVSAVRHHIHALSAKNYPGLSGLNSPDFVLMFMPVESAFIAAFEQDSQLFNEAFERHIVVVTPTTLLATLRTVANLWVLERQNENAKELYALAGKIYDKVAVFSRKMDKLGTQIQTADRTFHEAMSTFSDGRGSMLSYVERLKEMGAPTSKSLSDSRRPRAVGEDATEAEDEN